MASHDGAGALVNDISIAWLGSIGGVLALLGVIIAPISTGDTALRSSRLIVSDMLSINQKSIVKRLLVCIPIFLLTYLVMMIDFNILWRYFAWSNQTLAMITLWAVTVWLAKTGKKYIVTLIPAMFMTVVCVTYLFFAPSPEGFGLPMSVAAMIAAAVLMVFFTLFCRFAIKQKREVVKD